MIDVRSLVKHCKLAYHTFDVKEACHATSDYLDNIINSIAE